MQKIDNDHQVRKAANPELQQRIVLTIRQFSEKHPAFPQGGMRNLIFHAEDRKTSKGIIKGNGLEMALIRIGRKILIDEAKFFEWIDIQQEVKKSNLLQNRRKKLDSAGG